MFKANPFIISKGYKYWKKVRKILQIMLNNMEITT